MKRVTGEDCARSCWQEMTDRAIANSPPRCPDLDQEPPDPDEAEYRTMVIKADEDGRLSMQRPAVPHYSYGGEIEPIDLIRSLNLNFCEGSIVKYVSRWRRKGGLADLEKARVYLNWLILDVGDASG